MNLADLTTLLGFIIFTICTPASSSGAGAPLWMTICLIPIGAALGAAAAYLNRRLMYRFLGMKTSPEEKNSGNIFLYMLYPFAAIIISIAASIAIGNLSAQIIK